MSDELVQQSESSGSVESSGGGGSTESSFDMSSALSEMSEDLFGKSSGESAEDGKTSTQSATSSGDGAVDAGGTGTANHTEVTQVATTTTQTADPAPTTWTKEAQDHWATIPPRVKQEILKREADMFKGIEGYKAEADFGRTAKAQIEPYVALLRSQNRDPMKTVEGMLNTHYTLSTADQGKKQAIFTHLAKVYGVDTSALGMEAAYEDPQVSALRTELNTLKSGLTAQQQAQEASVRQDLERQITAFQADPKNTYFSEVVNDMVALLNGKVATTLQDAYDRAVFMNPVTRAKEQARITTEAQAKADKEAAEKAAEAKKAIAANVKSRGEAGRGTAKLGSIDDTMEETLARIKARDK